eukprot:Clim_evm99s156 gene=Clim_evmTU99s156
MSAEDELAAMEAALEAKEDGTSKGTKPASVPTSDAKPTESSTAPASGTDAVSAMKQKLKEMEEEAAKLKQMQSEVDTQLTSKGGSKTYAASSAAGMLGPEDKALIDSRSVFVSNVDWSSSAEELQAHFSSSGAIKRVTLLTDHFTGRPKGMAYIEFASESSVDIACEMNGSIFKGRPIKVTPKRTNIPGLKMRGGRGGGRGGPYHRGGRGGPRGRGGFRGRGAPRGGRGGGSGTAPQFGAPGGDQ